MDSEVDVDAHALPARPEIQEYVSPNQSSSSDDISTGTNSSLSEAAQQDLANERELVLPPLPSDEWPFGQMLVKIAKGISKDELEEIKEMFRGSDGIGKKVREKCDKCITLFGVLRENMYISPSDLLYLYKILYTLRRRDLLDIAVEYSRERHNVLHYFESSEMTEEGYETIKIHVEGPDFKKFKPESVERLRQVVAKIVCVPAEEIRLAGIEPGSSLLVILLLPEMYTTVLHDMLKRGRNLWELREIDVDVIHLRGQDFNLKDSPTYEVPETEQQKKLSNIYEQLRQKSKALENSNLQSIKKSKEIEQLRLENEDLKLEMKKLREQLQSYTTGTEHIKLENRCLSSEATIETLQRMHFMPSNGRKAISDMQEALDDPENAHIPRPFIKKILRCNTDIVSSYWQLQNANDLRLAEMAARKKKQMLLLLHNKMVTGDLTPETWLLNHYSRCLIGKITKINKPLVDIMKTISTHLNDDERATLAAKYFWDETDAIKICIEADTSLFLVGLECKETEVTQMLIQTETFLSRILEDIGRHDLVKIMQTKFEKRKMQFVQEYTEVQMMDGIGPVNIYVSLIFSLIEKFAHYLLARHIASSTQMF